MFVHACVYVGVCVCILVLSCELLLNCVPLKLVRPDIHPLYFFTDGEERDAGCSTVKGDRETEGKRFEREGKYESERREEMEKRIFAFEMNMRTESQGSRQQAE